MLPNQPLQPDRNLNRLKRAKIKEMWALPLARGDMETYEAVTENLRRLCAQDFHFWHDHFCWAFDEFAPGQFREFPLVEWEFQHDMAAEIIENIWRCAREKNDRWNGAADKCRKMAVTSTMLDIILWFGMFHGVSSLVSSKSFEEADTLDDLNTPMERIRWQMRQQPLFLFPPGFSMSDKSACKTGLINFGNGGRITAISSTGAALRQARGLIWFADEFGFVEEDDGMVQASSGTIKVRFFSSTPNGPHCKYYRIITNEDGDNARVFELDWWQHPEYAEGLYLKEDGAISSPWFDALCANESRMVIAREYLRDHNDAVGGRIFGMFREKDSSIFQLIRVTKEDMLCSVDPGALWFGAVWGHRDEEILRLHHENVTKDEQAQSVEKAIIDKACEEILYINNSEFKGYDIYYIGDPNSARKKGPQEKETDYEYMMRKFKMRVLSQFLYAIPAEQRREKRIRLLQELMTTWHKSANGLVPGLQVDSSMKILLAAFKGKYRRRVLDDGTVTEEVVKAHPYTEVVDCSGYLAIYTDSKQNIGSKARPTTRKKPTTWRPTRRTNWDGRANRFSTR